MGETARDTTFRTHRTVCIVIGSCAILGSCSLLGGQFGDALPLWTVIALWIVYAFCFFLYGTFRGRLNDYRNTTAAIVFAGIALWLVLATLNIIPDLPDTSWAPSPTAAVG